MLISSRRLAHLLQEACKPPAFVSKPLYYMKKPDWNHMQKGQEWEQKNWTPDEWEACLHLSSIVCGRSMVQAVIKASGNDITLVHVA